MYVVDHNVIHTERNVTQDRTQHFQYKSQEIEEAPCDQNEETSFFKNALFICTLSKEDTKCLEAYHRLFSRYFLRKSHDPSLGLYFDYSFKKSTF